MTSIPLFPLNTVLFPDGYLPLQIFEVRYLDMVKKCIASGQPFGVVPLLAGNEVRLPDAHELLAEAGTMARIVEWSAPRPGLFQIACVGGERLRLLSSTRKRHGLWMGDVETLAPDLPFAIGPEQQYVADALGELIASLQQGKTGADQMPMIEPFRLYDCGWVANRWCELLPLATEQKLRLLCLDSPLLRLELVADALAESGMLE